MKKKIIFWLKLIVMLVLVAVFCFCIVMPQYTKSYVASLLDKQERLLSIDEPKIVLVGNSNWVFGAKSEMLEEAFGMPVVNMGLHGGLGNVFYEQAATQNVNEGDIIILSYSNFADGDEIKNQELAWVCIENHIGLYGYIRLKDWPGMLKAYPTYLKDCLELWILGTGNMATEDCYNRAYFNEYGDSTYPRTGLTDPEVLLDVHLPEISDETIDRLNALAATVEAKGATILMAGYATPICENTADASEYAALTETISELLDFPLISKYEEYLFDGELFYDNYQHLNDEGAVKRTELLIQDLQAYLDSLE